MLHVSSKRSRGETGACWDVQNGGKDRLQWHAGKQGTEERAKKGREKKRREVTGGREGTVCILIE